MSLSIGFVQAQPPSDRWLINHARASLRDLHPEYGKNRDYDISIISGWEHHGAGWHKHITFVSYYGLHDSGYIYWTGRVYWDGSIYEIYSEHIEPEPYPETRTIAKYLGSYPWDLYNPSTYRNTGSEPIDIVIDENGFYREYELAPNTILAVFFPLQ